MSTITTRLRAVLETLERLDAEMNQLPCFTVTAPEVETELRIMHQACRQAIQQTKTELRP